MSRVAKAEKKNNKKLKIIVIVCIVLVIIAIAIFVVRKFIKSNNDENTVPVQPVSLLTQDFVNDQNKFAGMIVSQKTVKLQKDSNKTIKKVYVEVGDEVKAGDKLFEYDTDDINIKIEEVNLEVEKLQNTITNSQKQIENINAEIAANPGSDVAAYNIEIQTLQNEIKQTEYNIRAKNNEINKLKKSLKNVVIKSEIDGIVQSISDSDSNQNTQEYYGTSNNEDDSYMTIMQTGQYKVKGIINEQNMFSITSGDKVIIRSRIDEEKTWTGTVENIDTSNPESNNNNMYGMYSNEDSMTKSSRYPFYIALDSMDGLMLGQHVYIERDLGQTESREGLWLSDYYIVEEEGSYFVWVVNSRDKLEKRKLEIGQKNEDFGESQILSGLSEEDYIAIPNENLAEGQNVTRYDTMDIPIDMEFTGEEEFNLEELENEETMLDEEVVEGELPTNSDTAENTVVN